MDNSWIVFAVVAAALWIGAIFLKRRRQRQQVLARIAQLLAKYHDQRVVDAIMEGKVWQGMSEAQLIDSRGPPDEKDQAVYKTKIKQTWKYGRTGKNRFRERIYVENGAIVGWKE